MRNLLPIASIFLFLLLCQVECSRYRARVRQAYRRRQKQLQLLTDIEESFNKPVGIMTLNVVLSVVILPGGFERSNGREVGVIVHGLQDWQYQKAILEVFENDTAPTSVMIRAHVKDYVSDVEGTSFLVRTGRILPKTRWTLDNYSTKPTYTAIVVIEGRVIAKDELAPRPQWMEGLLPQIAYLTLYDLAIPGSAESGAYRQYSTSDSDNEAVKAAYHQEEDIVTQLLYGVRFFDFRPAIKYVNNSLEFWIESSGYQTGHHLKEMLEDINHFVAKFTKEVVFIDFRIKFSKKEEYQALAKLVQETCGKFLYKRKPDTSLYALMRERLSTITESNERVIVTYRYYDNLEGWNYPGVRRIELTNQFDIEKTRIKRLQPNYHNSYLWFHSIVGSPKRSNSLILQEDKSVRGNADRANFPLIAWLNSDKDLQESINIIAVDYVAGSGVVQWCEMLNRDRGIAAKFKTYLMPRRN